MPAPAGVCGSQSDPASDTIAGGRRQSGEPTNYLVVAADFAETQKQVNADFVRQTMATDDLSKAKKSASEPPKTFNVTLSRKSMGVEEIMKGDYDAAICQCSMWLLSDPDAALAYLNRARAWRAKGQYSDALADLKNVIRVDPLEAFAFDLVAQIRAACPDSKVRNGKDAVESATKACELTEWKKAIYVDTLAAAYAQSGAFAEAVRWQTKAIELQKDGNEKEDFASRLKLYQEKKPYREIER